MNFQQLNDVNIDEEVENLSNKIFDTELYPERKSEAVFFKNKIKKGLLLNEKSIVDDALKRYSNIYGKKESVLYYDKKKIWNLASDFISKNKYY